MCHRVRCNITLAKPHPLWRGKKKALSRQSNCRKPLVVLSSVEIDKASVMIDISRAGLNLKGVLIKGQVALVIGEEARDINRLIHLKYVTSDALDNPTVASYLSKCDDATVKVHMDHLISWNLNDSKAGMALRKAGWFNPLDT